MKLGVQREPGRKGDCDARRCDLYSRSWHPTPLPPPTNLTQVRANNHQEQVDDLFSLNNRRRK
jgi:hypothetical protein